ncbi:MAG: cytochrome c [Leptospira sp.]|nr:cytochrome c [Leptospira sp.]
MTVISFSFATNCGKSEKKEEQAAETSAPAEATLDPSLQKGKELYAMNCASCHGEKGIGDGPAAAALNPKPRNYKAPAAEWKNGNTEAGITKTLKNGLPGTNMVAYKHLGDENIKLIAKYVQHLSSN